MNYDFESAILKTLWLDLAKVFTNITKDSVINEKGFPDKLGDLTENDITELTKWTEFENCFKSEVAYFAWDVVRPMIKDFLIDYQIPKQQRGAYMKMRYTIPEVYFIIIKKSVPEYVVYSNFIIYDFDNFEYVT